MHRGREIAQQQIAEADPLRSRDRTNRDGVGARLRQASEHIGRPRARGSGEGLAGERHLHLPLARGRQRE